jgi:polyferredoxin
VGTAFCGWSCPQNSLSEWANHLTRKLLGKRAEVQLDGTRMKVVADKNIWINWLLLTTALGVVSLFFALIPLFYFYSPQTVWSFITFQEDQRLAASLHFIYFIFVMLIFIDIAFIRHFWCRFMCVYKVWQHGFKTKQTLHVIYDDSRAHSCEKCNYCVTQCFIDLDPRKTEIYDSCINCGECITACNNVQAKKGRPGLLRFQLGRRQVNKSASLTARLSNLSSRVSWTIPFALVGLAMFVWGIISYQSYHLAVYRADTMQGGQILDYRVAISNKVYRNTQVAVEVQGLGVDQFTLSSPNAVFDNVGRMDLLLHVNGTLAPGLHSFIVKATADSGWVDTYRVQHFVAHEK